MRKLMRTVRNAFRYGEAGFTLIELLVVIGILAALAGVVTLSVTQFMGRGECEGCKTELHNCQTAVTAYMVDPGGTLATCDDYVGSTLLTPMKYGGAWAVDANGKVTDDCETQITDCAW